MRIATSLESSSATNACPRPVSVDQLIEDLAYVKRRLRSDGGPPWSSPRPCPWWRCTEHADQGRWVAPHAMSSCEHPPLLAPAAIDEAVSANFHGSYRRLQQLYAHLGKALVVGESGWPSAGPPNGRPYPASKTSADSSMIWPGMPKPTPSAFSFSKCSMSPGKMRWRRRSALGLFDRQNCAKFPLPVWGRGQP